MLEKTRKLITPIIIKTSHINKIKAYKINKHTIDPNFLTTVL
jgi:hypothetical protein